MTQHNQTRTRQTRRQSRQAAVQQAERRRRFITLLGGVTVVAVVAVVLLIVVNQPDTGDIEAAPPLDASIPVDGRTMGNPDAPVTVVEWGDYQ